MQTEREQTDKQSGGGVVTEETSLLSAESSAPTASNTFVTPSVDPSVDRAFIIAQHAEHGVLLLKAFKKRKGTHHQLPGGHIDATDVSPAAAAARELFEETGLDIREQLDRLSPLVFPSADKKLMKRAYFKLALTDKDSCRWACEKRETTAVVDTAEGGDEKAHTTGADADAAGGVVVGAREEEENGQASSPVAPFPADLAVGEPRLTGTQSDTGEDFFLQLSHEHTGFRFERNLNRAAELVVM
jgi:ADP-ribose pyrophosphatase YjhB (NUDIX family)